MSIAALAAHDSVCWWLLPLAPLLGAWAWRLARIEPRLLQRDGQAWRLAPLSLGEPGSVQRVAVVMDFGDWLLLRCEEPGRWGPPRRRYLPLARASVGPAWGALRATLYSAHPDLPGSPGASPSA